MMNRPQANYYLDWVVFVLLSFLFTTGILLHFQLPPGSGNAAILSLTRHEWGDLHFYGALGFSMLVLLHLILHAKWIKSLTAGCDPSFRRRRTILAVSLVCVILLLGGLLALQRPSEDSKRLVGEGIRWEPRHQKR